MPRCPITLHVYFLYALIHTKERAAITARPDSDWQHRMHCYSTFPYGQQIKDFQEALILFVRGYFSVDWLLRGQLR